MKRHRIFAVALCIVFAIILSACAAGTNIAQTPKQNQSDLENSPAAPPSATAEIIQPTETPDPYDIRVREIMANMSLTDKICQLIAIRPEVLGGSYPTVNISDEIKEKLRDYPVSGIILTIVNLKTREQTLNLASELQAASKIPLFIAADEEGGKVSRLMKVLGTTKFNSMYSYKAEGSETAYQNALTIGTDMLSCGFNTNFAPVADVWTNPANKVIGERAYSDDYQEAADLVSAAVRGFSDSGIVSCIKHFPGHGDTEEDSHVEAAILNKDKEELFSGELIPFINGINAGADMVMMGHITVPAIDSKPASMSRAIVTDLLREELSYSGVIVCDSVEMGAVADIKEPERCLEILKAGVDIILGVSDSEQTVEHIKAAAEKGEYSLDDLDLSVYRVLMLKAKKGIIPL